MKPAISPPSSAPQSRYWSRTRHLTLFLFASWLTTTFGVVFFARELATIRLFGWPLSYYMAAQGTTLIHVVIVALYAWRMRQLDRRYQREVRGDA